MRETEVKMLYDGITSVRDEYVEEAQRVKLKKSHRRWRKWAVLAACFCLFLTGSFHVLDRLGYLSMGCGALPGTIVNGTYYYTVPHDGLYAYTPGGQSKRLLGKYWYDDWSVNEYGIYYKLGRSLYVLPHETGKSQKLYTLSRSDGTHITYTDLGDGNIALTIYNARTEIKRDILLDGLTGAVQETLTEPTPYSVTLITYAESVFTAGERTIHLVGDKFSTTDMQENGVSILPEGYSTSSRYPVRLGDNLVFRGDDANDHHSYPIIIIRSNGDDTFLSPNQYIDRIQGGTTDGSYLFYIQDNNTVMCMDAYSGGEWELTADTDSNFLDLSTDGEYLYTCAPWNDIQTCWKIVYAEDGRPIELQLVEENITE